MSYRGRQVARLLSALVNQAWENASERGALPPLLRHALSWDLFPSFFSGEMQARPRQTKPNQTASRSNCV